MSFPQALNHHGRDGLYIYGGGRGRHFFGPGEGPYKGVPWIQRCAGLWPRALLHSWVSVLLTVCSQRSHRVKGLTKGPMTMTCLWASEKDLRLEAKNPKCLSSPGGASLWRYQ